MSDKAQFFDPVLSYEHSVEWIAVDVRKSTNSTACCTAIGKLIRRAPVREVIFQLDIV